MTKALTPTEHISPEDSIQHNILWLHLKDNVTERNCAQGNPTWLFCMGQHSHPRNKASEYAALTPEARMSFSGYGDKTLQRIL